MSRIDDLIREHCPEGVERRPLGTVGEFLRGSGIQKSDFTETGFGCIHYGQIHTHFGTSAKSPISYISASQAARSRRARTGDLVVATTSEDVDAVGKAVAWLGDEEVAVSTDALILRHTLVPKYMSYFFQTADFRSQKLRHITGTKVRRISGAALAGISIPVPPVEVQQEVVASLDTFSQLEAELGAELEAELEARRQQYMHHRTELLSFDERFPFLPLGELVQFGTGSRNTNEAVPGGRYPFFVRSQEPLAINEYEFDETAIITAGDGVGVGRVFHFVSGKYGLHQRAYRLRVTSSSLDPRFLFHYIRHDFARYLSNIAVHASVTSLRKAMFERYPVPTPPIEEQARIAEVLDSFDELVGDLSLSLPAEISARRTQYEHFRNRMFAFEELSP